MSAAPITVLQFLVLGLLAGAVPPHDGRHQGNEPQCEHGLNVEDLHIALLQQKHSSLSKTNLTFPQLAGASGIAGGEEVSAIGYGAVHRESGAFADNQSATTQICGTRPLFPQLQFELEVFRKLGLVESSYARCRVPSLQLLALSVPLGHGVAAGANELYSSVDAVMRTRLPASHERRTVVAQFIAAVFFVVALLFLVSYLSTAFSGWSEWVDAVAGQSDFTAIQTAWKRGSVQWMVPSLSWLEPIIGRYGWATALDQKAESLDGVAQELHLESYLHFRACWEDELKLRGTDNANLLPAVGHFFGRSILAWMLLMAGAAAFLEIAGITVVLDMLLNYLHLARAAQLEDPRMSLDLLRPVVMFICLGFGLPMLSRAFNNLASLCDTYHGARITTALLTAIYEGSQQLPSRVGRDDLHCEVEMLLAGTRHMWSGALTSFAHLLVYPACMGCLLGYLIQHVGPPALAAWLVTTAVALLYFPLRMKVSPWLDSWGRLSSERLHVMQEAMGNMRAVKASVWEGSLSDRIMVLREEELKARFHASLFQSLLDAPLSLLPFVLVASCLLFCRLWHGHLRLQEIFACMQVMSGMVCCMPLAVTALQKASCLLVAVYRLEDFLRTTLPLQAAVAAKVVPTPDVAMPLPGLQPNMRHNLTPHVQVQGSFATAPGLAPVLKDVDVQIGHGELVAVVGEVASGKSAFLSAIRGELPGADVDAFVQAPQQTIFCSQDPWVVDGSVQDNVTLDEPHNAERLYDALDSAALLKDADVIVAAAQAAFKDTGADEDYDEKPAAQQLDAGSAMEGAAPRILELEVSDSRNEFPYFAVWNVCTIFVFVLGIYNVDWRKTSAVLGTVTAIIQGILHWSVLEFPIQTMATLTTTKRKLARADATDTTVILNYNVLALSQGDVDECMENMLEAYLLNLHPNVSATLVSATNDPNLQQYELQVRNDHRARIYKEVYKSGLCFAGFVDGGMHKAWRERIWSKYEHLDKHDFVQNHLSGICERFCREYMVLHRTTRVLRKCGQYQDLILLSRGEDTAFTYCDAELYNRAARKQGEPLFRPSEDVANICGRSHDYTLVLDSDTRVQAGSVLRMLEVASAYPEKAIVQPAIKMDCGPEDSVFMHLEAMRQRVYDPMNSTMTSMLGRSSFFGKGLIKNSVYAKYCLGTKQQPIESVPIDVLSHDTFEAAVLNPVYLADVSLLEVPCHNYITWDIRERRWNLGEMLLAMYFWPRAVGAPVRWLQKKIQGAEKFNEVQVRTLTKLDKVSSYFAHSALRQMVLKPMLLLYIVLMHFVAMRWKWTPLILVMFSILVFPKLATCYRHNYKDVMLETVASLLQFTPEAIVGTIRVLSAVKAHLAGAATWVPQRSVEEESKVSNPLIFSLRYLWYYSVFALIWGLRFCFWATYIGPEAMFVMTILGSIFMLPVYVGFTALPANFLTGLPRRVMKSGGQPRGMPVVDSEDVAMQAFRLRLGNKKGRLRGKDSQSRRARVAVAVSRAAKLSMVGPHGASLSKVERLCLSLARAAYSKRSNLVLLDDPFSSMDQGTVMHVLQKLICGPLMKGRTRIVAIPPRPELLDHFDRILLLSDGRVVAQGSPSEVLASAVAQELLPQRDVAPVQLEWCGAVVKGADRSPLKLAALALADGPSASRSRQWQERPELPDWRKVWLVLSVGGRSRLAVALSALAVVRLAVQGQIILLGRWADRAQLADSQNHGYHATMLFVVLLVCACQGLQSYSIQEFSHHVSRHTFDGALRALLKAPVAGFWDAQPVGRVLGRFAGDMHTVDTMLCSSVVTFVGVLLDLLVQQLYCFVVMPVELQLPTYLFVASFCYIFWNISSNLQLFSTMAFWRCQEKHDQNRQAAALQSVHAFGYQQQLVTQFCASVGAAVLPESVAGFAKVWAVTQLSICLYFQSTLIVLTGILRPDRVGAGSLTIIVASTFYIVRQLGMLIDSFVGVISLGLSLHSLGVCFQEDRLPQESSSRLPYDRQAQSHLCATDGVRLCMEDVCVGYGDGSPDVLQDVSVDLPSRSKALFVGAPGSGKSTALHCILRILEPRAGRITVNAIDMQSIGLHMLRGMMGFVPQDASIFRGTIRFNIDPLGKHSDEQIWDAIQRAQLLPAVQRFRDGIHHHIADDGSNLSFGQRQLLSVARAICQQPPLLLLDECGSALDPRTRRELHRSILQHFHNSTVVIAARTADAPAQFDHIVRFEGGTAVVQRGSSS